MALSAKTLRKQLMLLKPLLNSRSLKTLRKGQNKLGELMEFRHRSKVIIKNHVFEQFEGAWILPRDERRQGVILYLHGGGYTCGNLQYAMGFGSLLSVQTGAKVFCAAYRLAPEHPFPAAVEDAMEAYQYLLFKGYAPAHITLCGESAGGGLCYALCLKLKEQGLPMPCGVIALSPWTDLTASGESYKINRELDPTLTEKILDFYAEHYTRDRKDPLASPMFGDLTGLPASLIFVGGDEIMFSDAKDFHDRLLASGCQSKLTVAPDRWHAYLLYHLKEDQKDFSLINHFLDQTMAKEQKLRWMPLDNAAKIYPAARRHNWSNVFRVSATLTERVDVPVLQNALDVTLRRFPSIAVRLRRGVFWYYLEQLSYVPEIREESSYPLTAMSKEETSQCAFRVITYEKRIAVEIFHSLTDGNGAMVFLKSLVAEYLQQKHGVYIPSRQGVLGRLEEPSAEETEDSFQRYSGSLAADRREKTAWHLSGTPEPGGFLNLTCLQLPVDKVLETAHRYGVSLTAFLCAAMMQALQDLQKEQVPDPKKRKPIKVLIPVNLRKLFPSKTLRNFVLYTTPEILPRLGEYSFQEICKAVHHHMGAHITPKEMSMKIATNVNSELIPLVRVMPLFIKNMVMKAVFDTVGECKSCLTLSNLGAIELPDVMLPFVERMDFILGVQASAPNNCGVLSFGNTLYINFIRNIREPNLEYHFFKVMQKMGIPVLAESNSRQDDLPEGD